MTRSSQMKIRGKEGGILAWIEGCAQKGRPYLKRNFGFLVDILYSRGIDLYCPTGLAEAYTEVGL